MNTTLQKKIDFAIMLLKSAEKAAQTKGQPVEICYSGGKDSDVILELAKMAGINYRAIYKNTTIDPPGTIAHVRDKGIEMVRPVKPFFSLVADWGYPNGLRRFCCRVLKEYKILDYNVVGVRRSESVKRAKLYKEPEQCKVYSDKSKVRQYMPILEWTNEDVAEFLQERNVKCAPVYYDKQGTFHIERRLGCMACPLISRQNRIEYFKAYPNLVKAYIRAGRKFLDTHTHTRTAKRWGKDVYAWLCNELFCDSKADFELKFGRNLFDEKVDCKQFLEQQFNVKL